MTDALTFCRDLAPPMLAPDWPSGYRRLPFDAASAPTAHALLQDGYANGSGWVDVFDAWQAGVTGDAEYDPDLCFLYDDGERPAAFALVWTSGFIKDFAVASGFRRKGIGRLLLMTVFAELSYRGHAEARLKVVAGNHQAIAFYTSCGMRPEN